MNFIPCPVREPEPRQPVYGFQTRMLRGACQHLHSYLILENLSNPKSSATSPTFMPFITNTWQLWRHKRADHKIEQNSYKQHHLHKLVLTNSITADKMRICTRWASYFHIHHFAWARKCNVSTAGTERSTKNNLRGFSEITVEQKHAKDDASGWL